MSGQVEDPVVLMDDETNGIESSIPNGEGTKPEDVVTNATNGGEADDDPEEYVVEAIRARKKDPKTGNDLFLVKWEDYPESDNTWEPAENLKCPEIVQKFLEEEANKRKRKKVDKIHNSESSASRSQSQPVKKSKRADGSKSRVFVEDEDSDDSDESDDDSPNVSSLTARQRQKQLAIREPTPEPAIKGFQRGLGVDKIIAPSIGDNDKLYFFIKWQGLDELELLEVEDLEKNAPYELCRWYRERFYCNIKYNKLP